MGLSKQQETEKIEVNNNCAIQATKPENQQARKAGNLEGVVYRGRQPLCNKSGNKDLMVWTPINRTFV
jgi:hypothetical protein